MLFEFGGLFRKFWRGALILGTLIIGTNTLFVAPVSAATGINQQLNFQGRLLNNQGAIAADGNYNVEFKIYQDGTGTVAGNPSGTLKWTEDWLNSAGHTVQVVNGYISVQLGSVNAFGNSIDWNQDTIWLSVNIGNTSNCTITTNFTSNCGGDGEMIPMKRLSAVPYSLNSARLGGLTSADFIQNTTTVQAGANLAIGGSARADTSILTPTVDTNTAVALNIGTTNATAINLNQNVAVAAGKSLSLAGGNTASRPGSPTEGMMYFDTTTKQLLTYSNGKWQADRNSSTKIVAASTASQALKDSADYVATGTSDQNIINTALTAAAGGSVYLTEGTFTTDDVISIPNDTTLRGAGRGTLVKFANINGQTKNMITNSDTTATSKGVTVRDMQLDGNWTGVNTTGTINGIAFSSLGGGSGSSARQGPTVLNTWVVNFLTYGIYLNNSPNGIISGNNVQAGGGNGIYLSSSNRVNVTGNISQGNNGSGIVLSGVVVDTITGNTFAVNGTAGIYLNGSSNNNTISTNNLYNNGGGTTNNAIYFPGSANADFNTITGNTINDTSGTTSNYAINFVDNTSNNNYLADNVFTSTAGTSTINDPAGTNTVYANQARAEAGSQLTNRNANDTQAFAVQKADGTNILAVDTTNSQVVLGNASTAGKLTINDGSGHTGTILMGTVASNYTYTVPTTTANDSFCLVTLGNCAADSTLFVQNQNAAQQATSKFWISGTGRADTSILTPLLDAAASATALNIGTTNASVINLNQNVALATTKTLSIAGDTRTNVAAIASPTEGMMTYDTTNKQLLVYANGKWQADRTGATLVAASDSSQAFKDAADFVGDGNTGAANDGDQVQITQAIADADPAGSGRKTGKVYLFPGTYTIDAGISLPNNITFSGAGTGTVITIPNSVNATFTAITNTTTGGSGTGIVIQDMKLDGNKAGQTGGNYGMYGITFNGMGSGTLPGGKISNVTVINWYGNGAFLWTYSGIYISTGQRNSINNVVVQGNTNNGLTITGTYNTVTGSDFTANNYGIHLVANNNTVTGNSASANTAIGIYLETASQNTITGNVATANTNQNIYLLTSNSNTVSGNQALGSSASDGIGLASTSTYNIISSNIVQANSSGGIALASSSSNNTITGNKIHNNGGNNNKGIYFNNASNNTITNNTITDTANSASNNPINIDVNSSNTYLSNNTFSSTATGGTIADASTTTVYVNQPKAEGGGQITNRVANDAAAFTFQKADGTNVLTVDTTNNKVLVAGTLDTTTATTLNIGTATANAISIGKAGITTTIAGDTGVTLNATTGTTMVCRNVTGLLSTCDATYLTPTATNFIQNSTSLQATSNFHISGTGQADTALISPSIRAVTDGTAGIKLQNNAGTVTALTVDTTNNRVGIGTATTPASTLHVGVNSASATATTALLEQQGLGNTTLQLKNTAESWNAGIDSSDGNAFKITTASTAAVTTVFGNSTSGNQNNNDDNNYINTGKYTANATGNIVSLSVNVACTISASPNNQFRMAIFSDNGSGTAPNTLLGQSAAGTLVNGWNQISVPATAVTSGTVYWIAYNSNGTVNTNNCYRESTGAGANAAIWSGAYTFGSMPASWPGNAGSGTASPSFYATIQTGAGTNTYTNSLFQMTTNGRVTLHNSLDSTSAFQVQNAAGTSVLNVDTTNSKVLIAGTLDTTTATALNIGTTSATAINLNQSVTVAATKTLRIAGDTRTNINAIAAPTEGMMTYDTTNKQLLVYANGKWQADRNSAILVAANDSSDADKAAADYVATGTADQTPINNALTAADPASGSRKTGKVFLFAGTYTINGSISIPNNTTLVGAGRGSNITIANSFNTNINAITNTTGGNAGTGIVIQDLRVDGNRTNNTSGTMYGIYMNGVGANTTANNTVLGAKIINVWSLNWRNGGIFLNSSNASTITNSTLQSDNGMGLLLTSSSNNIVSNNTFIGNSNGIYANTNAANNIISGNFFGGNGTAGVTLQSTTTANTVTGNRFVDNGNNDNNSIYLVTSTNNIITNNVISDATAPATNYAINITDVGSTGNYLGGNTLGTGSINDAIPGSNLYEGQVNSSGSFLIQPAGTIELMKNTNVTGTMSASTSVLSPIIDRATPGNLQIGTNATNSTTITIGSAAVTTTIAGNTGVTLNATTGTTTVCRNATGLLSACDATYLTPTGTSFILNGTGLQASSNFHISGNGQADTSLLTPLVDGLSGVLGVGTGAGSTSVTIGKAAATTLLASSNITVGSATATPANANSILGATQNTNNKDGNAMVIQGSTGLNGNGGTVTVQGGNANGTGTLGGNLTLAGGTGSTSNGAVILATSTFQTLTNDANCFATGEVAASCTISAAAINNNASVLVGFSADGQIATMPDPSIITAGRVVYVTASNGTKDFTLRANTGAGTGIEQNIAMRKNTTATMIWNGADWTAAGASSSTTMQAAYDNTLQSAGGAELVVSKTAATNGLTIRDSTTNSVNGALLTVQSSSAANLFSVNSNVTEYTSNSGAETYSGNTTTFPATTWVALTGSAVTRNVTTANIATGQGSAQVVTTTTAGSGVKNVLTSTLSVGQHYNVSFTAKLPAGAGAFTDLGVYYSVDGSADTVPCIINQAIKASVWTKINCAFTASGSPSAANSINIRQIGSGTIRTFYVDNISVTIAADYNYATDGDADNAGSFATNWPTAGLGTVTTGQFTGDGFNASSSATSNITAGAANAGIRNKLSINPLVSTLYRVSVYVKGTAAFTDFKIRYSPIGSTTTTLSDYVDCVDYNTQTISTSAWTQVTCYINTSATAPSGSGPYVYFVETASAARTYYVDAFSMTLASNSTPNVQIGSGNNGGPTTLFTVDKGASAPIAANNDALLGSMYYDTTLGKLQCYEADGWGACGSSPDNIITISPEYTNAVMHGTGIGTMTSDICSDALNINDPTNAPAICGANESYNFYKWTSPQVNPQTYSIYVTYQLPTTFKSFNSGQTSLMGRTDNGSNGGTATVAYTIYKNSGAGLVACGGSSTVSTGTVANWQTKFVAGTADPSTCSFGPGNSILFKIDVTTNKNANAYVGNLNFSYSNK